MEDEVGKAAAVARSQGYEVTALREPIKGLKKRNGGAAEQNAGKQTRAGESSCFFPYQLLEPAAEARQNVLGINSKGNPK